MAKYNSDPTLRYRENRGNRAAEKRSDLCECIKAI